MRREMLLLRAIKAKPIEGCGTSRLGRLTCGIAA
jgi:hypothetical protein